MFNPEKMNFVPSEQLKKKLPEGAEGVPVQESAPKVRLLDSERDRILKEEGGSEKLRKTEERMQAATERLKLEAARKMIKSLEKSGEDQERRAA